MPVSKTGLAVLILCFACASAADAARRHRVNQNVTLTALSRSAHYPSPGSQAVYSGTVRSALGRGAILQTVTFTRHPAVATFTLKGTSTAYYAHGTTRATFTGTATVKRDGRFGLAGHGRYTGGTLYRRALRTFSFTGTAPGPPPPAPPPPAQCTIPAGWKAVASDADLIVIVSQASSAQEYRYCDLASPSRGFRLLVHNDPCGVFAQSVTCTTIDGVALSTILYHSTTWFDSPGCNGLGTPIQNATVQMLDARSGRNASFPAGTSVIAAGLSPPGVAAWIFADSPCNPFSPSQPRTESLQAFSFSAGTATTLDSGNPGEMSGTPLSLGGLELFQCSASCAPDTVVISWTHDGTRRYQATG